MIPYLLKLSLVWTIFLVTYELFFSKATCFTLNRIYLFLAITAGVLIPLIPLHLNGSPASANNGQTLVGKGLQQIDVLGQTEGIHATETSFWTPGNLLMVIYISGMAIALFIALRSIVQILRKAIYGDYQSVQGHRIFSSKRLHAPFSFMGWIFISNPDQYAVEELSYILNHEDAHNRRYHWLDMILIQVVFIVFWFHPLVWRFRYLLKMNHEFEADRITAADNTYGYGHFLLSQTLLRGTPVIAHSFHFSPIKNRIAMLTKTKRTSALKYALVLPVLLGCTVLFAKSVPNNQRVREGDITSFRGHEFHWLRGAVDSIQILDAVSGKERMVVSGGAEVINRMDKDSVYQGENLMEVKFKDEVTNISDYLTQKFKEKVKDKLDTISQIPIQNVVVNAKGKIEYYEINYFERGPVFSKKEKGPNVKLEEIIDKILMDCPAIETKTKNGIPVPTYYSGIGNIVLNSLSFKAIKIDDIGDKEKGK